MPEGALVLIAYATNEGQTARIAGTLAKQFEANGHLVSILDLGDTATPPDPAAYDGIVVAASVHAGKHQESAQRFVSDHRNALDASTTAFLSVSLSAVAKATEGQARADEQIRLFLEATRWKPDFVEALGGAFRYSGFSRPWRAIIRLSQRLFRRQLEQQGWPDMTLDQEFTDWDALRRFGQRFCAKLQPADSVLSRQ